MKTNLNVGEKQFMTTPSAKPNMFLNPYNDLGESLNRGYKPLTPNMKLTYNVPKTGGMLTPKSAKLTSPASHKPSLFSSVSVQDRKDQLKKLANESAPQNERKSHRRP